jgi:hypothetical protein
MDVAPSIWANPRRLVRQRTSGRAKSVAAELKEPLSEGRVMPLSRFVVVEPRFSLLRSVLAALLGAALGAACTITTGPPPGNQPPAAAQPAATTPAAAATPAATTQADSSTATAAAPSASATYNPCAGKKCGDRCNLCPPSTPGCFETALVKLCHPDGQCKPATTVDCTKPAGG